MFEIYKFEYDNDFISQEELQSYIPDYDLSQDEYNRIVGDNNATAPQAQSAQPQA